MKQIFVIREPALNSFPFKTFIDRPVVDAFTEQQW